MALVPPKGKTPTHQPSLYTVRYILSGSEIPYLPQKPGGRLSRVLHLDFGSKSKEKQPTNVYATFSFDDGETQRCDLQAKVFSMDFTAREPSTVKIALYAQSSKSKKNKEGKDDRIAARDYDVGPLLASKEPLSIRLGVCEGFKITAPSLMLQLTVQNIGGIDVTELSAPLSFPDRWMRLERYVRRLVSVGAVISELDPRAKAVLSLLSLGVDALEEGVKRNEAILDLIDQMSEAIKITIDRDDPNFENQRAKQKVTRDALVMEIYCCLSLIRSLSSAGLVKRLSSKSNDRVQTLAASLRSFIAEMESKGHLDTQLAVFRTEKLAKELVDERILGYLPYAKNVQPGSTKSCSPGTRVDLLREIEDWAFDPAGRRAYFLYGAAGKGKSAIAHAVALRLREVGAQTAFFAFDRTTRDREAYQLFPTLAAQLARRNKAYHDALCAMDADDLSTHDIQDQARHLVADLLAEDAILIPVVFVIDALDECPDSDAIDASRSARLAAERRTLLECLRQCVLDERLPYNIRFLITGRPDDDIRMYLASSGLPVWLSSIDDARGTEEDIKLFVHEKLAHTPVAHMADDVAKAAQTLFECAALLCRELTKADRPKVTSSRSALIARVMRAPGQALYTSYRAILEAHFDLEDDEGMRIYKRILTWILIVQSPQRRAVFSAFAGILLHGVDVGDILSGLGSILMGTVEEHQPVRPLHTSFRDFILDESASGPFAIDLRATSHADIADACLYILNSELCFNICRLPTSFPLNEDIADLARRLQDCISPGLQYACRATASHLELSSGARSDDIPHRIYPAVERFLKHQFLFWLEACSLMNSDEAAIAELQSYLVWSRTYKIIEYEELVADYLKFLIRFREGIVASAPQVYISGLVFAPRNSHVCRVYGPRFRHLVRASGAALEEDWPAAERSLIHAGRNVYQVAYSSDGTRILSRLDNDTIRVWDAVTGHQIGDTFVVQHESLNRVWLTVDGSRILSSAKDHTIRAWDISTGQQIGATIEAHDDWIEAASLSPNGERVATGSHDRTVRIWDLRTGERVGEVLRGHNNNVTSVVFSHDGRHVASASWDHTIRIWDVTAVPKHDRTLVGHTDSVNAAAFSPDNKRIASGSADNSVRTWDVATAQQIGRTLRGHSDHVWTVAYSSDGQHIVSGSYDFTVRVWNAETGHQLGATLRGHDAWVMSVTFSPNDKSIVSCSQDRTIRIWESPSLTHCIQESPSGKADAAGADMVPAAAESHAHGAVQVGQLLGERHEHWVNCVAISPDGKYIASASSDCSVRVWDAETGRQRGKPLIGHTNQVNTVAFSPDCKYIVSGCSAFAIRLWITETGQAHGAVREGHQNHILAVSFSPDGKYIASASQDYTIRIWDVEEGSAAEAWLFEGHDGGVTSVAFSPDGKSIVSGSHDHTIRVWDLETKQQLGASLAGHEASVASIAISPDGKRIVSGSHDQTLRVWDMSTGQQLGEAMIEHDHGNYGAEETGVVFGEVNTVSFSPDGKKIVSGSSDRTIRVWNAATREPIGEPLRGHDGTVTSVAFSPEGERLISGSSDHTIRIWNAPEEDDDEHSAADDKHHKQASQLDFNKTSGWLQSGSDVDFEWISDFCGLEQLDQSDYESASDSDSAYDLSRILWIPRHIRHLPFVFSPYHRTLIPPTQPHIAIDLDGAAFGEDWPHIHSAFSVHEQ